MPFSAKEALYVETCLEATVEPACLVNVLVPDMSNSALTLTPSGSVTVERNVGVLDFTHVLPAASLTDSPELKDTPVGVPGYEL